MLAPAAWSRTAADGARVDSATPGRTMIARENAGESREVRPRVVVAGPRRHTIAAGETFASIAQIYYGTPQLAEALRESNRGRIARGGPKPGDLLVIPPREELPTVGGWVAQGASTPNVDSIARRGVRGGTPRTGDESGSMGGAILRRDPGEPEGRVLSPATDGRPKRARGVFHTLGPNETPRSIARDRLGDARRAAEMVDLNHDLLAAEGRWKAGLRILLPPDAR
jgi:hypothetical protein